MRRRFIKLMPYSLTAWLMVVGVFASMLCVCHNANAQLVRNVSPRIEIKIETSRSHPTAGTGIGVSAEIKNLSDSPVYLNQKYTTLSVPPEIVAPSARGSAWWSSFPTEPPNGKQGDDAWDKTIGIQPGDTYEVFWYLNPSDQQPSSKPGSIVGSFSALYDQISSELYFALFPPGDYKIAVVAKGWTDPNRVGPSFTASQSTTINVAAPQSVILLGAAVGGLVAYAILPETRRRLAKAAAPVIRAIPGGIVAMLLSMIVVIMLSRIAETQFPIRVAITDFWGAIAIGFAVNYIGIRSIERILQIPDKESRGPQPSVPAPPTLTPATEGSATERAEEAKAPRE